MLIDIDNPDHLSRLENSIRKSREKQEPFRRNRRAVLDEMLGQHYGDSEGKQAVPVNLLELMVNVFSRQLVANSPRVIVTSPHTNLSSDAFDVELGVNQSIERSDMEHVLRLAVKEAMISPLGIVKLASSYAETVQMDGEQLHLTTYGVKCVTLDNWVHDMSAGAYGECTYSGDRYSLPLKVIKESPEYIPEAVESVTARYEVDKNEEGDSRDSSLGSSANVPEDDAVDFVDLWDIWLPSSKQVVTFVDRDFKTPIRVVNWDGPDSGPYHILVFNPLPGNVFGMVPVSIIADLHAAVNASYRKLLRSNLRSKRIGLVGKGSEKDAQTIQQTPDGSVASVMDVRAMGEGKYGGVDNIDLAFAVHLFDTAKMLGGNLDVLGGFGPQSDTLGQDRLIAETASKRLADMQDQMISFVRSVVRAWAWYVWTDPLRTETIRKPIPGTNSYLPVPWNFETARGDWLDYNLDIEPYSMRHQSPSTRLQTIMQFVQQIVMPLAPMFEQQQMTIDLQTLVRLIAKYTDMTELDSILMSFGDSGTIEQQRGPQGDSRPRQSPNTTRTHIRENRPGSTMGGRNEAMIQSLLGAGQPDSVASIGRAG